MEYFIDADPGINSGVDIPLTAAVNQNLTVNVPTGTLAIGFHVLTVRAQDANFAWSNVENKAFYVNQSSTLAINNIDKIEYFIDADPGRGLGVDVLVASSPSFDFVENVPTLLLSNGFHTITVRVRDLNGEWGIAENKTFYVNQSSTLTINNIDKIEYFIDVDPGRGLGVDVPVASSASFDLVENVPTSLLSNGFHTITVRVRDINGEWGIAENKVFYVNQSSTLAINNIDKIEYFIDADPGRGLGVDVSVASSPSFDIVENVPTALLTNGFHSISVRVRDLNGEWSLVENKVFYVNESSTLTPNNITKIEYFIDADPGRGFGVDVPILAAVNLNIIENVPTSSLSEGIHILSVRAQDQNGEWSLCENKAFYVAQSSTLAINNINKVEYFVDNDPGQGLATNVPIAAAAAVNITENVPTASLNAGFHVLTVRVQDVNGIWSIAENKVFFVSRTLTAKNIVKVEYFIDNDPGHALGTDIPITSAATLDFMANINTTSLSDGFHMINIRAQDENGVWSIVERKNFFVDVQRQIVAFEYAIDTDPGLGLATFQSITPTTSINQLFIVDTSPFTIGGHNLILRVKDENNFWSKSILKPFSLCDGVLSSFTTAAVCIGESTVFTDTSVGAIAGDSYSWDYENDGAIDDNTFGNTSYQYALAGTYTAALIIDRGGCRDTSTVSVLVKDIPNAALSTSNDCVGSPSNIIDLSTGILAGDIYSWDFDGDNSEDSDTNGNQTFTFSTSGIFNASLNITRNGCVSSAIAPIEVTDLTADFSSIPVCLGSPSSFSDLSTGTLTGDVYSWDFDGDGIIDDNTFGATSFTYTSSGSFNAALTIDRTGCQSTASFPIMVENIPNSNAGADQNLCTGNTTLSAIAPSIGETGSWSFVSGSGFISDSSNPFASLTNLTTFNNELRWTVTNDLAGCSNFDNVLIQSNQPITVGPSVNIVSLGQTVNTNVQTSAITNVGDVLTTTILVAPTKGVATISANGSIDFAPNSGTVGSDTVRFQLCNQCNNCTDSYLVIDIENNSPVINPESIIIVPGGRVDVDLRAIISDPNNNLDLTSLRIVEQPISGAVAIIDTDFFLRIDYTGITFVGTDQLTIEACDLAGACATSIIFIEVNLPGDPPVTVYNAVSPNGDGKHDFLEIENIDFYQDNKIIIFSRWGKKVYEVSGYDNNVVKFSGIGNTGGAKELPGGTYFYRLDLGNGSESNGYFVLKN